MLLQKRSWVRQSSGAQAIHPKSGDIGYVGGWKSTENHSRFCQRFQKTQLGSPEFRSLGNSPEVW